jgi:hypothetical protein
MWSNREAARVAVGAALHKVFFASLITSRTVGASLACRNQAAQTVGAEADERKRKSADRS